MEAFGNSKTTRNDNSSRFGKYIEIVFSRTHGVEISGARIRTYLLERSRLVYQPKNERNYHIFYQICAAAPAAEKMELKLDSWDKFNYLKQGKSGVVRSIDDVAEFADTQKSFSIVGVSVSMQWNVFRICAALLHIGNIKIDETKGSGKSSIDLTDPALIESCRLLGIPVNLFKKAIIERSIITRNEKIVSSNDLNTAITARDSLAKYIYSQLFAWLVKIVNLKLSPPHSDATSDSFIGVLDIYGFEHFELNSFEQFCINYANEKLQQEFTRHVFKLEQDEYVAEKINWVLI